MKKRILFKVLSILFALMALLAVFCAVTVTGSGFLDLSSLARYVCIGAALVCAVLAWIFRKQAA